MTTDWRKAMQAQADLAEWWQTKQGQLYGLGFLDAFNGKPGEGNITGDLARHEYLQLQGADTYTCTEEMLDVVIAAIKDMPDQKLMPQDLPSSSGFLYLPSPIQIRDINENQCSVRAIRWATFDPGIGHGILMASYSDPQDPNDYAMAELQTISRSGLVLLHLQPWRYGHGFNDFNECLMGAAERGEVPMAAVKDEIWSLKFMAAFWNLCRGWADIEVQYPTERHLRKRLVRSELWGDTPTIRVVTLRKPRQKIGNDEAREVAWSHRWIVNVRWRQQHYSSMGPAYIDGKWNPDSHRLVYVMPFVKGPADKPLVVKKSVYRLAR